MSTRMFRIATSLACAVSAALASGARVASAQVAGVTGTLIITNKAPYTATIVDVASGATLATLPTGVGPHEVVVSSDGKTAVVTDYGTGPQPGSTLTVIDVPALKIVRRISIAPAMRPHGIVFLPGDSLVAVTSEQMRAVVVVSLASGEVVRTAKTDKAGSHMVGVAADGRRAWTGDIGSNTVTELDLSTGAALRAIAVPSQPEAINVTADGAEVWVGSNATGRVSVVSAATGEVTTAAEGLGWPYRVLFTPDQSQVFLPDYRNEVVRVLDRASRQERGRIAFTGGGPQGVAISPDGKYVFVSLSAQARVAVIRVSDRTVIGHVDAGDTPDGVAYTTRVIRVAPR